MSVPTCAAFSDELTEREGQKLVGLKSLLFQNPSPRFSKGGDLFPLVDVMLASILRFLPEFVEVVTCPYYIFHSLHWSPFNKKTTVLVSQWMSHAFSFLDFPLFH